MKKTYEHPVWQSNFVDYVYSHPKLISKKETEDYIIEEFEEDRYIRLSDGTTKYAYTRRSRSKFQKFICVGGPLDGQKHNEAENYYRFNTADSDRRHWLKRHKHWPKVILVHESKLGI